MVFIEVLSVIFEYLVLHAFELREFLFHGHHVIRNVEVFSLEFILLQFVVVVDLFHQFLKLFEHVGGGVIIVVELVFQVIIQCFFAGINGRYQVAYLLEFGLLVLKQGGLRGGVVDRELVRGRGVVVRTCSILVLDDAAVGVDFVGDVADFHDVYEFV